jgi:hypothetical protein
MFTQSFLSLKFSLSALVFALAIGCFSFSTYIPAARAQTSNGTTVAELQAMIATLMAQISALQGGGGTVTPPIATTSTRFAVGENIKVVTGVRVRNVASVTGVVLGVQNANQTGVITAGPIVIDGHTWWKIDYATGPDGWSAQAWLVSLDTAGGLGSVQRGFYRLTKGAETKLEAGIQDAPFAKIEIPAANVDRYLNKVVMLATSNVGNTESRPWETFDSISFWSRGNKVGSRDIGAATNWHLVSGPMTPVVSLRQSYEITLFAGNIKIPAGTSYAIDLGLTVDQLAAAGDGWSFAVPTGGVVVWSDLTKHVRYGNPANNIDVTITASNPQTGISAPADSIITNASSPVATSTSGYTLADVKAITQKIVDPSPSAIDDEYTLYVVTLTSGKKYQVKAYGNGLFIQVEKDFRATGYTGDVTALLARAKAVSPVTVYQVPKITSVGVAGFTVDLETKISLGTSTSSTVCGPIKIGVVAWGDSIRENIMGRGCQSGGQKVALTHVYKRAGTFTVTVVDLSQKRVTQSVTTVAPATGSGTTASSTVGSVLGVSVTDQFAEIQMTLSNIQTILSDLK